MVRYAFVDVDQTLVNGNLGKDFAKELLKRGPRRGILRDRFRFTLYILKSVHLVLLYPFSFLYPVYTYLQDAATDRFFDLAESWDPREADLAAKRVAERADLPNSSISFLQKLHSLGYSIVLLSASPTIVLKHLVDRIQIPLQFVGTDDAHPFPFTRDAKAKVILEEFSDGEPCIVVGNPKREPFWLAKELAIVVRKPKDLKKWVDGPLHPEDQK